MDCIYNKMLYTHLLTKVPVLLQDMDDSIPTQLQIDWNYLHLVSNNTYEFELELLNTLVELLPTYLGILKSNFALADLAAIGQTAHCIKGATASSGIKSMQEIAAHIEETALAENLEGLAPLITDLETAFQELQNFVSAENSDTPKLDA